MPQKFCRSKAMYQLLINGFPAIKETLPSRMFREHFSKPPLPSDRVTGSNKSGKDLPACHFSCQWRQMESVQSIADYHLHALTLPILIHSCIGTLLMAFFLKTCK